MKYVHIADCHLGGWREPKLRELGHKHFILAIDTCIKEKVDFVLLAGDLFNTSLPGIESISVATRKLKELADLGIPVYAIPGSHDFSPSGKTMLDVLEYAGLLVNVVKGGIGAEGKLELKFTVDVKTGVKITGLLGKKGGLEKSYYDSLDYSSLEAEEGYKIFMFHTAIEELKPKELSKMEAMPISLLPRGFNYYAGGHVHIIESQNLEGHDNVVYPGPTFPNNFSELEKLGRGNMVIVEDGSFKNIPLILKKVVSVKINSKDKSHTQVEEELRTVLKEKDIQNAIVTIKIKGVLSIGKPSDIDFKEIVSDLYSKGAFFVMKNTSQLISKEFEEIKVSTDSIENIEETLIAEHLSQSNSSLGHDVQKKLAGQLLSALSFEKHEGEKVHDFEQRIKEELDAVIFEN